LKKPASADERQVAKKNMIKNPGKENFFLNGRKIVLGWPTRNTIFTSPPWNLQVPHIKTILSKV
jgi:hypothetical protein